MEDPLISFASKYKFSHSNDAKLDWDFNVSETTVLEYVAQVVAWSRLCMLEDAGDDFSCVNYWLNNVLLFDCRREDWPAETVLQAFAGSGQKLMDLLSVPLDEDKASEEYKQAEEVVWTILTKGSMQKISHGKGLTQSPQLGTLWDRPENKGRDSAPGTFAELLRYGSVHFRQKRRGVDIIQPHKPPITFRSGVLEPWSIWTLLSSFWGRLLSSVGLK